MLPRIPRSRADGREGHCGEPERHDWLYAAGLADYLMQSLAADPVIPLFEGNHHADGREMRTSLVGEGATWCDVFSDDGNVRYARAKST